jgi:hypothetical protein
LRNIESSNGVNVDNMTMESGWYHQVPTETQPVEVYVVGRLLGPTNGPNPKLATSNDGEGAKLWKTVGGAGCTTATFTVTRNRPDNTPGIEIQLNGATV